MKTITPACVYLSISLFFVLQVVPIGAHYFVVEVDNE